MCLLPASGDKGSRRAFIGAAFRVLLSTIYDGEPTPAFDLFSWLTVKTSCV